MSIWKTIPVQEEPEILLSSWRVMELGDGSRHFVGWNVYGREGRVSSSIVEFDNSKLTGRTSSGRVYKLLGDPGYNSDAAYVWSRWAEINKVDQHRDITGSILL
jgi:hypothetical protein